MILKNDYLTVTFNHYGEIDSVIFNQSNYEYIWQNTSGEWNGKNPTLFPKIGNFPNGEYTIKDKSYNMVKHGLIRNQKLEIKHQDEKSIVFEIHATQEMNKHYPYEFHYEIQYELINDKLIISYTITNCSEDSMPFEFGLHPAFNFKNGTIHFDVEEEKEYISFMNGIKFKKLPNKTLTINDFDFQNEDTYVFHKLKSNFITITDHNHWVKISIGSYPYVALWRKVNANFLCIEPWYQANQLDKKITSYEMMKNCFWLNSNQKFITAYTIQFNKE